VPAEDFRDMGLEVGLEVGLERERRDRLVGRKDSRDGSSSSESVGRIWEKSQMGFERLGGVGRGYINFLL